MKVKRGPNRAPNRALEESTSILSQVKARRREELAKLIAMTGETTTERARRLGVTRQAIYDWASGRSWPNRATAIRIAELTGVPVEDIRSP
jgi:DNA-binding XRE family transcriptional regulator